LRSHFIELYYATLAPYTKWIDFWATDYLHIMAHPSGIVTWYKGTGLRPYLDRVKDATQREDLLNEYRERLRPFVSKSEAGTVPFSFWWIFIVAVA
jgi:trans-aconitate 2-methyltransferase